jgi:hypothetical protein
MVKINTQLGQLRLNLAAVSLQDSSGTFVQL